MENIKNQINRLKIIRSKLNKKKFSLGSFMQINSPEIAEIFANSNLDWVALDIEHGNIELNDVSNLFRAIELYNKVPIVRLSSGNILNVENY